MNEKIITLDSKNTLRLAPSNHAMTKAWRNHLHINHDKGDGYFCGLRHGDVG